tara:strand:+ start:1947 stop:2849 length:903 start_codon:yes stop_codon:yes gene_type:complete
MIRRFLSTSKKITEEDQYFKLIKNALNGDKIKSRNGVTYNSFGESMKFNLKNNTLPLLTSKKVAWKTCVKELLWFIKGSTDNRILKEQNVKIWNGNATREFLDSRGLHDYSVNDLGPIYGHQWRFWNSQYKDFNTNYNNKGIDQLENVIKILNNPEEKFSRRNLLTAWNPEQVDEMALPPCHVMSQFYVNESNELSCSLYQRSGDIGLGIPFNIASYSILTHLLAKHCDLKPGSFHHFIGVSHIYEEHLDILSKQMTSKTHEFPKIDIVKKYDNINDYRLDDILVYNYKHEKTLKMPMIA